MKKLKLAMLILCTSVIFAGDLDDKIERNLMKTHPTITDGRYSFTVKEYDVDMDDNVLEVEIELSKRDSANFRNVNNLELEKNLSKIVETIRKDLGTNRDIKIKIELDDDSSADRTYRFKRNN